MSTSPLSINDPDGPEVDVFAPPTADELASGRRTPFDDLKAALEAPVEREPKIVRVPKRPGVTLRFNTDRIDDEKRKAWQKRATKRRRGSEDEVDEMLFSCLVIANANDGVLFKGIEAQDVEGTPLTFAHRQLWDMVGAGDPATCIRRLFANDAHVLIASGEVLMAAGFDDDLSVDPTMGETL
jgi:hypothetical protein